MNYDLIINKYNLKEYKKIEVICENTEVFSIPIEYVIDINMLCKKNKKEYTSDEGFIVVSKDAQNIKSSDVIYAKSEKPWSWTVEDCQFINRIPKYLDICCICLVKKDGKEINVLIPYDLIESIFGGVVEFSNCHSFELDSKGNMIIKYGNLSLMPKRHKLNFTDTIENWNEFFNNTEIDYISINVNNFHYHRDGEYGIIEIYVDLFFSKNIVSKVVLVFNGVTDCEFIMDEPSYNLAICQLIDGSFFAQINYMSEFKFKRCYIKTLIDR